MKQLSQFRDSRGYVHLLWSEREGKGAPIRYALYSDGKAIFRKTITTREVFARNPKIFVDERGNIYAVWQERKGPHRVSIVYATFRFSEYGISDLKQRIISEGGKARHPDIYADRKGRVFIVWEEKGQVFLGRLQRGGHLTKRAFKAEKGDLQKLPTISPGKKGILIAWNEGEKEICIKRCEEKSLRAYKIFRVSLNKGGFARRLSLKEGSSGIEISLREETKGHLNIQGRDRRFLITGSKTLIPLYDLHAVDEEDSYQMKWISDGRERILLSPDEEAVEMVKPLAFLHKGSDVRRWGSGFFESCLPHGPPDSVMFIHPILSSIYINDPHLKEFLTAKENRDKNLMEASSCFSASISMRVLKGGDLREEGYLKERFMNA